VFDACLDGESKRKRAIETAGGHEGRLV